MSPLPRHRAREKRLQSLQRFEASFRNRRLSACSNSLDIVICLFDLSKTHLNLRRPKFLVQPLCVVRPNIKCILVWKDEVDDVPVALGLLLPVINVTIGLPLFRLPFPSGGWFINGRAHYHLYAPWRRRQIHSWQILRKRCCHRTTHAVTEHV